jgi:hypothetical protein
LYRSITVKVANVHDDGCVGRRQRNGRFGRIEQHLRLDAVDRQMDGHHEHRGVVGLGEREPLLTEDERRPVELGRDQRITRLPDPRIHQRPHGHRGVDLFDRVPQIASLGVPVRVGLEVEADALAEALDAEVHLEHAQQRPALLVGQHVEHAVAVLGRLDRELDRARAGQRVGLERCAALEAERGPAQPVGTERVAARDLHEGGEGLVEPDPVPPSHRHQVAEPHVGDLVGDDIGERLQFVLRCRLRIGQQQALAIGDAPEVLHRARGEVGQRQHVELVGGVRDPVVVLVPAERERADLQPERREVSLARYVDDAHRHSVDVDGVGGLERPDDECHEVGAHHHRRPERDDVLAVVA